MHPIPPPATALLLGTALLALSPARASALDPAAQWPQLTAQLGPLQTVVGHLKPSGSLTDQNDWNPAFEGQPASQAFLSNPHIAAADALGNIYIADKAGQAILKITPDQPTPLIHTWVGTHLAGNNATGPTPGTAFQLNNPNGLFVQPDGTLYIYDPGNRRICKTTPDGTTSVVFTDPDPLWLPSGRGLWVNPQGDLIYYTMEVSSGLPPLPPSVNSPPLGGVLKKWSPTSGIQDVTRYDHAAPSTAGLDFMNPGNIAVHPLNHLVYVTDRAEDDPTLTRSRVWQVAPNGALTPFAGSGLTSGAGDGAEALDAALNQVRGIAFFPDGSCLVCTHKGGDLWFIDTQSPPLIHRLVHGSGKKDYFSGDGSPPPVIGNGSSIWSQPRAVTITPAGSILITANDSGFVRQFQTLLSPPPPDLLLGQSSNYSYQLDWISNPGTSYLVQRSDDLLTWSPRSVITPTTSSAHYREPLRPDAPRTYFRLKMPPP